MSTQSKIEWTDSTWAVTRGCSLKSPGCTNCYAMKQAHRFSGKGGAYEGLTKLTRGGPVWTGDVRLVPSALTEPFRWVKGRRVFVDSMSDLFHPDVPFDYVDSVFFVMSVTTRHTYQVLTKRPDRMLEYFASRAEQSDTWGFPEQITSKVHSDWVDWTPARGRRGGYDNCGPVWPLRNVWLGVSVEDQERADERIPLLLRAPAAVCFLSCEPLLGPLDLRVMLGTRRWETQHSEHVVPGIDWVIVGGESGPGARPFNITWARSIAAQCANARVPYFVKQLGSRPFLHEHVSTEAAGPGFSMRVASLEVDTTISLRDRKGGDWAEWPSDLRVRQFPRRAGDEIDALPIG